MQNKIRYATSQCGSVLFLKADSIVYINYIRQEKEYISKISSYYLKIFYFEKNRPKSTKINLNEIQIKELKAILQIAASMGTCNKKIS